MQGSNSTLGADPSAKGNTAAGSDPAWNLVRSAGSLAAELQRSGATQTFSSDAHGDLLPATPGSPDAVLEWSAESGWRLLLTPDDTRFPLLDLYLPICGATMSRPITVGHLGQSLDGFIATRSGDSQFVTGSENLLHMHRMRALCDAVLTGAGTIAADDPQLTTRHVAGRSPLRVVFDPTRRLGSTFRVFTDGAAPTLYVCGRSRIRSGETHLGQAAVVGVDEGDGEHVLLQVLDLLHARGCARVFVEGGGVTVSAFLEANLLDRLHIAVAPVLIGDGRPAIRLAPHASLRDCRRPGYRVYQMGGDVLFDCDVTTHAEPDAATPRRIARII